jgi:hypothetical protein
MGPEDNFGDCIAGQHWHPFGCMRQGSPAHAVTTAATDAVAVAWQTSMTAWGFGT